MRKTVKISTEEHQRLINAERVLTKEVKRLQDENLDLKNKGTLDVSFMQSQDEAFSALAKRYDAIYNARQVMRKLWRNPDALMNKVSLRSRWPELYNVLDKELK